jgi:predicted phosphodiesterase
MLNKVTIIGDVHCRPIWKDIVNKESDSDKIIFLGDYLTPREPLEDDSDCGGVLYEILTYKEENKDKIILLRGNHKINKF